MTMLPPSAVTVGGRVGVAADADATEPSLTGKGSGIGGSSIVDGSSTPKHIASCFDILNDAFAHAECASFVPIATLRIGIIAGHNR